jgi:hypothetical protein
VYPVFALDIANATIQSVGCEHQKEVPCLSDALEQIVVKLPGFQPLHVDEHRERPQVEVNLQQTVRREQPSTMKRICARTYV